MEPQQPPCNNEARYVRICVLLWGYTIKKRVAVLLGSQFSARDRETNREIATQYELLQRKCWEGKIRERVLGLMGPVSRLTEEQSAARESVLGRGSGLNGTSIKLGCFKVEE